MNLAVKNMKTNYDFHYDDDSNINELIKTRLEESFNSDELIDADDFLDDLRKYRESGFYELQG